MTGQDAGWGRGAGGLFVFGDVFPPSTAPPAVPQEVTTTLEASQDEGASLGRVVCAMWAAGSTRHTCPAVGTREAPRGWAGDQGMGRK